MRVDVHRGDDPEAESASSVRSVGGVQRPADADVHRCVLEEQPLLGGPAERRAVRERRAEVGVPGVEVGVEVHQGDRAVHRGQARSSGQAMVWSPPIAEQAAGLAEQRGGGRLDLVDGLLDVERVARRCRRRPPPAARRTAPPPGPGATGAAAGSPAGPRPGRSGRPAGRTCRCRTGRRPPPRRSRATSSRRGSSAKVGGPAKRGVRLASIGPRSARPARQADPRYPPTRPPAAGSSPSHGHQRPA